jgi:hypothetical protein
LPLLLFSALLLPPTAVRGEDSPLPEGAAANVVAMTYGWPFVPAEKMRPRGGSTEGAEVTLDTQPSAAWQALQNKDLSPRERDRQAILALAGAYRVSFQFVETMGAAIDYEPPRPYFSWGTEWVHVLDQSDRSVRLQHTLVMYFREDDGTTSEPMVMKHWRQDWTYEDRDLHTYRGNQIWARKTLTEEEAQGSWTQAVYQVDDSPRYETNGRWDHTGGVSRWTSDDAWRPLPRREFSVRDDYNVLAGTHTITVTPRGWVHEQDNRKLQVSKDRDEVRCVACETGIDRYERITAPDVVQPGAEFWAQTGGYWQAVREEWAKVLETRDRFELKQQDGGSKLYEEHFGYAAQVEDEEVYDADAGRAHAHETIGRFLVD